jgi:hypothetical protein
MQAAINQLSSEIQKWMARLLDSGRQSETLWFEGNSQDKAACVLSSLTGSLQLARLLGNDYFFQAVNQIYVDLKITY